MLRYNILFYGISALVFIIDQLTKVIVKKSFFPGEIVRVLPFLNLTFVENKGIAFGLFHDGGDIKQYVLLVFTIIAIAVLIYMFYALKDNSSKRAVMFGFIMGGALGNLYDRLFHGAVVDFIEVYYRTFHWPVFNMADTFITIGIAFIFYFQIFKKEHII